MANLSHGPEGKAKKGLSPHKKPPINCAVYDGHTRIGAVRQIGAGKFEATDLAGKVIGRFRTPKAASASLIGGDVA